MTPMSIEFAAKSLLRLFTDDFYSNGKGNSVAVKWKKAIYKYLWSMKKKKLKATENEKKTSFRALVQRG